MHAQLDYRMAPLEEQRLTDPGSTTKDDDDAYMLAASIKDTKTTPSSAAAPLLSFSTTTSPPLSPPSAYGDHYAGPWPQPRRLGPEWTRRLAWLFAELCVATLALLFAVYGILVYKHKGHPAADEDSPGRRLYNISLYVSIMSL